MCEKGEDLVIWWSGDLGIGVGDAAQGRAMAN